MNEFGALMLSVAIESPLAFAVISITRWPCRGPFDVAVAVMIATAVTHPQLWTASLWLYPQLGYWSTLGCTEGLVVLVEAAIIAWTTGLSALRSLLVSAIANGASMLAGIILLA